MYQHFYCCCKCQLSHHSNWFPFKHAVFSSSLLSFHIYWPWQSIYDNDRHQQASNNRNFAIWINTINNAVGVTLVIQTNWKVSSYDLSLTMANKQNTQAKIVNFTNDLWPVHNFIQAMLQLCEAKLSSIFFLHCFLITSEQTLNGWWISS